MDSQHYMSHAATPPHTNLHMYLVTSEMTGCYGNQARTLHIGSKLGDEEVVTSQDHITLQAAGWGRERGVGKLEME